MGLLMRVLLVLIANVGARGLKPPLYEPLSSDYFGSPKDEHAIQLERVRDISSKEFEERVRSGRPFIIEDAGRDNPFLGKDCAWYRDSFPSAKMRAEYTGGPDERFIKLGGKSWLTKGRPTKPPPGHVAGSGSKFNAPYVWHVKDGGHEAPAEVKATIQGMWRPAYFLEGAVNLREANESQEFWFSLRNGSVMAHADTYCIPAVSLQLRGQKRWRLQPAPPPINSILDRYDSHDGGIYTAKLWHPTHEATVNEGEAIVFFPSQFHETFVPESNPECTVATTFQFQHPLPARFLRAYRPTLSNSHLYYEGHCIHLWHSLATMDGPATAGAAVEGEEIERTVRRWKATIDEASIRERAHKMFSDIDADSSGALSVAEFVAYLQAPARRAWAQWFFTEDYFYDWRPQLQEEQTLMSEEVLRYRAHDAFAYHDVDEDGSVSEEELRAALLQWHVVHYKLKEEYSKRGKKSEISKLQERYKHFRELTHAARQQSNEL